VAKHILIDRFFLKGYQRFKSATSGRTKRFQPTVKSVIKFAKRRKFSASFHGG